MSTTKTPAQQVQDALTLIGTLFVRELDAKNDAVETVKELDRINDALREDIMNLGVDMQVALKKAQHADALRADLEGTTRELEIARRELAIYMKTDTALRNDIAVLKERIEASKPTVTRAQQMEAAYRSGGLEIMYSPADDDWTFFNTDDDIKVTLSGSEMAYKGRDIEGAVCAMIDWYESQGN